MEKPILSETETNDPIATENEVSILQFRPDGNDEQWRPLHSFLYQLKLYYGQVDDFDVPDTAQDWGWLP